MTELILDGSTWTNNDDVYDAFFRAVGAPSWHGRNFNALNDSIATGSINKVEVPYTLVIAN
jgi:RNAse (barnase) inhibitor barstar